jgi:hypothetical protein
MIQEGKQNDLSNRQRHERCEDIKKTNDILVNKMLTRLLTNKDLMKLESH